MRDSLDCLCALSVTVGSAGSLHVVQSGAAAEGHGGATTGDHSHQRLRGAIYPVPCLLSIYPVPCLLSIYPVLWVLIPPNFGNLTLSFGKTLTRDYRQKSIKSMLTADQNCNPSVAVRRLRFSIIIPVLAASFPIAPLVYEFPQSALSLFPPFVYVSSPCPPRHKRSTTNCTQRTYQGKRGVLPSQARG